MCTFTILNVLTDVSNQLYIPNRGCDSLKVSYSAYTASQVIPPLSSVQTFAIIMVHFNAIDIPDLHPSCALLDLTVNILKYFILIM